MKVHKHMCTTIFNKTQRQYSEHQYVHMMMSMRLNTCMETIRRNNSWNISRSVVVDDATMLVIVCTENMEWLHEQGCSEYMQAMVNVYMYVCTTI